MSVHLKSYFTDISQFPELGSCPPYIGHLVELGWILHQGFLLNRTGDTGLYDPTTNWKRRGEVGISVIMNHLNVIYNYYDGFRLSESWRQLLRGAQIAVTTQFWNYNEFREVEITKTIKHAEVFHNKTAIMYYDKAMLTQATGLVGVILEDQESSAMEKLSRHVQETLTTFFPVEYKI